MLTIRYWPAYDNLLEDVQALIAAPKDPERSSWIEETRHITGPLVPAYEGEIARILWKRCPGTELP